jgi:hypothetical protein
MVSLLLSRCRETSRCDWIIAVTVDLLTLAWVVLLIAWWL